MNHQFVLDNQIVLRYTLGDLTEVERDEFEEHFYSCSTCAQEVLKVADVVEAAGKALRRESTEVTVFSRRKPGRIKLLLSRMRRFLAGLRHRPRRK